MEEEKMELEDLKWEFLGSHFRWGTGGNDTLWVTELPRGERIYCWGWEADPRDWENTRNYFLCFSIARPKECWDGHHPYGFYIPEGLVFQDFIKVLEYLGYEV